MLTTVPAADAVLSRRMLAKSNAFEHGASGRIDVANGFPDMATASPAPSRSAHRPAQDIPGGEQNPETEAVDPSMVWPIVIVPAHPNGGLPGIEQVGRGQALHVAVAEQYIPSASVPPLEHRPHGFHIASGNGTIRRTVRGLHPENTGCHPIIWCQPLEAPRGVHVVGTFRFAGTFPVNRVDHGIADGDEVARIDDLIFPDGSELARAGRGHTTRTIEDFATQSEYAVNRPHAVTRRWVASGHVVPVRT